MAAPPPAPAAAAAEPTPMTPRPVVTDEKGYHYRWDIAVGDTPSDLDWGEEIIKKDKRLSFEKDVRVQEFDKKKPSDEVVNLQRKPETKQQAELPETVHQEVLKRKKRKKKKKKKRRRPRKKYRFELGKPIKRDEEDEGGDEKKEKKKKSKKKKSKKSEKKKGSKKKKSKKKKKKKEKKESPEVPQTPVSPEPAPVLQRPVKPEPVAAAPQEPVTLEPLLTAGATGQPKTGGQELLWQALPRHSALQLPDGQQRMVLEPGTTEQIVQGGPGGAQIKIRTKTEIEMIPPEEEPPPTPRRGIEAITRQGIAEHFSPDGGEQLYTTSQDNIIRRYAEPGRKPSRSFRRSRALIPGARGLSLSPDTRVIRTTTRKVEGPDGAPRMDTKVDISLPKQKPSVTPITRVLKGSLTPSEHPGAEADVRYETQLLNQLSEMVRDRTERELKRAKRREHRDQRKKRREERRSWRARRRRSRRRRRSMGDVPYEAAPQMSVASTTSVFAHRRGGFDTNNPFIEPLRSPYLEARDIVPVTSVANALEQCCRMLENVADEFRIPPEPPLRTATRRSNRKTSPANRSKSREHGLTALCSWLGLIESGGASQQEPSKKRGKHARSHSRRRKTRSPKRSARRRSSKSRRVASSSSTRASTSKLVSSTTSSSCSRSSRGNSSSMSSVSTISRYSRRTRPRRRRSRREKRGRSRTSTKSSGEGFSKEFEFVTHITSKGQKPQETQKLVIVGRASEETVSTAGRAVVGTKMYQKYLLDPNHDGWYDHVGDWDDYRRYDVGLRLEHEDRIDDRGDDRVEDREEDGGLDRGVDEEARCEDESSHDQRDDDHRKKRKHHKGRRRDKKYNLPRCWRSEYCDLGRVTRSCERSPSRFSRYTAGYSDYRDVRIAERVSSHTRVTMRSFETDPPMAQVIAPTPSESANVGCLTQNTARIHSGALISGQTFIDLPAQEEILVSNTNEAEPQKNSQLLSSVRMQPCLQASQIQSTTPLRLQVPPHASYDHALVQGSPSSSGESTVSYSSLVEIAESNSIPSQLPSMSPAMLHPAPREVHVQTLVSDSAQCASLHFHMAPEHRHPASFPQFALPAHDYRDTSNCREQHIQIVIEDQTYPDSHSLHVNETPVIVNQPPPQFIMQQHEELLQQHEELLQQQEPLLHQPPVAAPKLQPSLLAASQPAPILVPSPEYTVYSNPHSVLCGLPQPAHGAYPSYTTGTISPLLHPMSTFTASAPVLTHHSRTYSEEFYTDSSDSEGEVDQSTLTGERALTASGTATFAAAAPQPMQLHIGAATNVLAMKPAFLDRRALHARDLEAKSSKLNLGQAVHTYDQWMANQARYEATREGRRTSYQTHIIVAFLLLVATLLGFMAFVSVYGKKQFMSIFGDYDSEYNQTMNSPWLKYFLRSFNFNGSAKGSNEDTFGLCRTPECRAEGMFVSQTLNWTVNPCNDFYSFVCSDWAAQASAISADQVVVGDIENTILKYLTEGSTDDDSLITPAKKLFRECVDLSAIQALQLQPLRAMLNKTGLSGWPLESDGNKSLADVWSASAKILRYFGLPTFLTVRLTKVSRTSDAVVVLDKTNGFGNLKNFRDNVSVSQRSWDLLNRMRVVNTDVPLGLAEEVLEFMHYVVRLTGPASSKDGEEVRSLGDLNLFQPFVVEAMGSSLLNLSSDPVVLLQSSDYVSGLIEVIRITPPHISLNYLGHVLTDHLRVFILSEGSERKSRARVCLHTVEQALPSMVHYAAYLKFRSTLENLSIRNIIDDLKHELMTAIAKVSWMDVHTKSQVLRRLTETQIQAFFPHWMSNAQLAREMFAGLPGVSPGQALLSYQAMREHEFHVSLSEPWDRNDVWRGSVFDTGCFLESNNVYFPISLLNVTGRTTQFFLLFQIPRIGARLVGCLLRAALQGAANDDERATRWSQPSRQNYRAREDCFRARHADWTAGSDDRSRIRQHALLRDVTETAAIRPVLKLYKMYIMSRSRHRTDYRFQNAEGISTNQLFYVYYAASMCRAGGKSGMAMSGASAQMSVNWALMDDPEFESTFGCSQGTGMNPATRCRFW
ncbi:unnamed protein product [Ixodes persulcatus]